MTRRRVTAARRLAIFEREDGLCHICGLRIYGSRERWDLEHIIPLALGGADEDGNLAPAHVKCHAKKTKQDVINIAKSKRMRQREAGISRQPRAVIPGSKTSGWKRTLDGRTVRR